jgi:hypothetical protein
MVRGAAILIAACLLMGSAAREANLKKITDAACTSGTNPASNCNTHRSRPLIFSQLVLACGRWSLILSRC